jgi:hypothetical protein
MLIKHQRTYSICKILTDRVEANKFAAEVEKYIEPDFGMMSNASTGIEVVMYLPEDTSPEIIQELQTQLDLVETEAQQIG